MISKVKNQNIKMKSRDHWQITFVMLNRFCPLSNPLPTHLPQDNIRLDGIPCKIKWKIFNACLFKKHALYIFHLILHGIPSKLLLHCWYIQIVGTNKLFFAWGLTSPDIVFYIFRTFIHSTTFFWKKIFVITFLVSTDSLWGRKCFHTHGLIMSWVSY